MPATSGLGETTEQLHDRCPALVSEATNYGILLGDLSLQVLGCSADEPTITLVDGRTLTIKAHMKYRNIRRQQRS